MTNNEILIHGRAKSVTVWYEFFLLHPLRPLSFIQRRPLFERDSKKGNICLGVCDFHFHSYCPDLYQSTVFGIGHQRNNPSTIFSRLDPRTTHNLPNTGKHLGALMNQ